MIIQCIPQLFNVLCRLKFIKCVFIISFLFITANLSAQEISPALTKAITALDTLNKRIPTEKAYLHLDKPYYAAGDTIWFKAYVTIGPTNQLSGLSGAVYAELLSETNKEIETIKLPLLAGMGKGSFILTDSLEEGNYRIRAYTQWMRNNGDDYFFDKTFSVGNSIGNKVFAKVDYKFDSSNPTATIVYQDAKGNAYARKDVTYRIKNGAESTSGKGTTDDQGVLVILLNSDKKIKLPGAQILTTIEWDDKKKALKNFPVKMAYDKSDIQFFPESGSLVNGVRSKVAFKATGIDGLGLQVKGVVTDNESKEVAQFSSQHLGMGLFNLLPEKGKTYKANVTYPDGSTQTYNLPAAADNGYSLAVFNNFDSDTLLVRIYTNAEQLNGGGEQLNLVGQSGGEPYLTQAVNITKAMTSLYIPKNIFPSGVAQFTLFKDNGTPLNERITLIRNNDQMQIEVSTPTLVSGPRKKVELNLNVKDKSGAAGSGQFSVAVIDETKTPVDESGEYTIFSQLLLSSDIKGYIEKPNYYFTNVNEEVYANTELLMLTQGYRRFAWKDLVAGSIPKPTFSVEKLATEISGTLKTLGGKVVPNGRITLFSIGTNLILDTVADAQGKFKFTGLLLPDSVKFTVQGKTAKNGNKVQVFMDKVPEPAISANKNIGDYNLNINGLMSGYLNNSKLQFDDLILHGVSQRNITLGTVTISGSKNPTNRASRADYVLGDDLFENCPTLLDCIQGRLPGVTFRPLSDGALAPHATGGGQMLLVIDGIAIETDDTFAVRDFLENTSPEDIKSIEIYRPIVGMSLYGSRGENGVLEFRTKRGVGRVQTNLNVSMITPKGFTRVKEFYSPKYAGPKGTGQAADLRTTIYWNPAVSTDAAGKAKLDFFNADSKATYRVVVEGINGNGELGRQVFRYNVE
jgi:hypothetical protein